MQHETCADEGPRVRVSSSCAPWWPRGWSTGPPCWAARCWLAPSRSCTPAGQSVRTPHLRGERGRWCMSKDEHTVKPELAGTLTKQPTCLKQPYKNVPKL